MRLKNIVNLINYKVPPNLCIPNDFVGLMDNYDLNQDISNIKIFMDLFQFYDDFEENTLFLTHHKPLFLPNTPTYVLHSNWDIIDGGANDALAEVLNLDIINVFDEETGIGRICKPRDKSTFLQNLKLKFKDIRIVNKVRKLDNIGIISGFGLKNPNYIELAKKKNIDLLISGDLVQETAILAINRNISLIDLGHHNSEVPGLYKIKNLFEDTNLDVEIINHNPWKN